MKKLVSLGYWLSLLSLFQFPSLVAEGDPSQDQPNGDGKDSVVVPCEKGHVCPHESIFSPE